MGGTAAFQRLKPGPRPDPFAVAEHQRVRLRRAMVELAAARGYQGVTLKELSKLSGVSTRSFYTRFSGKEECFLDTFDHLVRDVLREILRTQQRERRWDERLRIALRVVTAAAAEHPAASRLVLLESTVAGERVAADRRHAEGLFGALLADRLTGAPGAAPASPLVQRAIVAGVTGVCSRSLAAGTQDELPGLADELLAWALSYLNNVEPSISSAELSDTRRWADRLHASVANLCRDLDQSSAEPGVAPAKDKPTFLTGTILKRLRAGLSPRGSRVALSAEASALAAATVLHDRLAEHAGPPAKLAAAVSFVAAAPLVGAPLAREAAIGRGRR